MIARTFCLLALALAGYAAPTALGIDHVPVAVGDLERAGEAYRALGFVLKPGRPHANGIRNLHAKFPDGTEIELITAPAATDALTRRYRDHLEAGDGPAFMALFAESAPDLERRLEAAGTRVPGYIFFGPRQASPTDRPEHFAHPNSARALTRVWLAGDDLSQERQLLTSLGGRFARETVYFPRAVDADIAHFPQGSVALLPGRYQMIRGRPIVGITVRVGDLAVARRFAGADARGGRDSIFVQPRRTLGYWLEFRQ